MTYDTVATLCQVASLLMFVCMFAAAIAYAFWPANRSRFEKVQQRALDLQPRSTGRG